MMNVKKSVFEYHNYREFLKDSYNSLKAQDRKYSFRFFSKLAGFKSSSTLKMIMDGKRNMGPRCIDQFGQALKLKQEESSYFRMLVLFNQAKTASEKQNYAQALMHFNDFKKNNPLTESQYNLYAFWYIPVICEMAGLPGFKNDPEWIAKKLKPNITTSEARKALAQLVQLQLLVPTKNGKLVKAKMNLRTTDEVASTAIAQWHRDMMKLAADSIDLIPRDQRDISSITCSMSLNTAKKIKEKIQKFRKEIMEFAAQDESPNMVYQLNFQLFPQAEIDEEGSK